MNKTSEIRFIGTVTAHESGSFLSVDPAYRAALQGLDAFSHAIVLWWAHECDSEADRKLRVCRKPYRRSGDDVGVFGSRSPARPNPIGLSVISLSRVDADEGVIETPFIDALPGTPVVDLKPYFPASDRSETARTPAWCRHWPRSLEDSATFDWSAEFE